MIISAPVNYYDQVQYLGIGVIQTYQIYTSGTVTAIDPYVNVLRDDKTTMSTLVDGKSSYNVMSGWHFTQ